MRQCFLSFICVVLFNVKQVFFVNQQKNSVFTDSLLKIKEFILKGVAYFYTVLNFMSKYFMIWTCTSGYTINLRIHMPFYIHSISALLVLLSFNKNVTFFYYRIMHMISIQTNQHIHTQFLSIDFDTHLEYVYQIQKIVVVCFVLIQVMGQSIPTHQVLIETINQSMILVGYAD